MSQKDCFHCGQEVSAATQYSCMLNDIPRPMCCIGCQSVAQTIIDQGLVNYYRHRELSQASSPLLENSIPIQLDQLGQPETANPHAQWEAFDDEDEDEDEDVQSVFVRQSNTNAEISYKEADLVIDGLTCAACLWLLHQQVRKLSGVIHFNVNLTTQRAYVQWQPEQVKLSQIMAAIAAAGYQPSPYQASVAAAQKAQDKRQTIIRLGVAGLAAMQVMMLSFGLYAGQSQDMSDQHILFFRWLALALTTPVIFYAAQPFFKAAYRALKNRHLVMDVPVSIAIGGAYTASVWATVTSSGDVYFDAVCMFTFLLLFGRFVEAQARYQAGHSGNELHQLLPPMCTRIKALDSDEVTQVAVSKLICGDYVRVLPGATLPADGTIVTGSTSINEAALSGEFIPVTKQLGDSVSAGTVNVASSIDIVVTQLNSNSRLQQILSLVQQAHSFRPKLSQRADTVAHYFVFIVLLASASVYGIWYFIDADKAFWVTLSVLVITCPCALSLAGPTATAVATDSLRKQGILMTREDALEQVAQVDTIVFDKTGTLTTGSMALEKTIVLGEMDQALCLQLACALESQSEHPVARAFSQALSQNSAQATHLTKVQLTNCTNHPSLGVSGTYNGLDLRLGQVDFTCEETPFVRPALPKEHGLWLLLADQTQALAWFKLSDAPRKGLQATINQLKNAHFELHILSGNHKTNVAQLAHDYAFDRWQGGQNPQQKLNYIKQLQQQGKIVMMVGDGINDAPVMAAADAALAMASGTDLSKPSAPALLLRDDLNLIQVLLRKAQQTHTIMQQNLTWALLYNLIALPLAAAGMIPPWGAAIGMSMSSLIVVLNATRLK